MVRINWTFQAQNDLKGIAEYISKDSKRYAKLQIDILTIHHSARDLKRRKIK